MKLTIHCGPPKTGTTALQEGLSGLQPELLARGVLYPRLDRGRNHKWLTPGFISYHDLPKVLRRRYDRDLTEIQVTHRSETAWEHLRKSVHGFRGSEIVLSSGAFFHIRESAQARRLQSRLAVFSADARFVLYLRDPVDLYFSQIRHNATAYGTVKSYKPLAIRPFERAVTEVFGGELVVRKLGFSADITSDFLEFCLGDFGGELPVRSRFANQSLSNEAIQFLIDYRRVHFPQSFGRRVWQLENLRDLLHEIDPMVTRSARSGLHTDIISRIRTATPEVLYWRERFGIDFTDDQSGQHESSGPSDSRSDLPFGEVCVVDPVRLGEITEKVSEHRFALRRRGLAYFLRSRRRIRR